MWGRGINFRSLEKSSDFTLNQLTLQGSPSLVPLPSDLVSNSSAMGRSGRLLLAAILGSELWL